jgi:hypothetical protein
VGRAVVREPAAVVAVAQRAAVAERHPVVVAAKAPKNISLPATELVRCARSAPERPVLRPPAFFRSQVEAS